MSAFSFIQDDSGGAPAPPDPAPAPAPLAPICSRYGLLRYEWDEITKRISVFPSPDFPAFASPATQKQFKRDGNAQILDLLDKLEVLGVLSYVDQKEKQEQAAKFAQKTADEIARREAAAAEDAARIKAVQQAERGEEERLQRSADKKEKLHLAEQLQGEIDPPPPPLP
jgi:hypothetical protein